jgi:selenide,water dikinase
VELALAIGAKLGALKPSDRPFWIGLAAGGRLVATLNPGVRRRVRAALARHDVTVLDGFRAVEVSVSGVQAEDGRFIQADAVLISTAARAPCWLRNTGLPVDAAGFVQTRRTLACIDDPSIFAVGDCATVVENPMPKAGVFAVRQGSTLTENLRRRVRGTALTPHSPDLNYLSILMTGDGSAIAGRGDWLALEGKWVWRWKDWIDRRFMRRFSEFRR